MLRRLSHALDVLASSRILGVPWVVYGCIVSNPSLPSSPTSQGDQSPSLIEAESPVSGPITRRAVARGPTRRPEAQRGFTIEIAGAPALVCGEILGFREAMIAAGDPRAQAPLRLGILATTIELDAWLDGWSEDDVQVRRAITVRRCLDNKAVTVIATLASHGYGVDPSLAVESVMSPRRASPLKISRSGTYTKVDVVTALGPREAEREVDFKLDESTFG